MLCTIYIMKYAYGFVMLSAVVDMISDPANLCDLFTHIFQGYFPGTGVI